MAKKISICIPTFNEIENVRHAVKTVQRLLSDQLGNYESEIIITDNASTDETWEEIQRVAAEHENVRGYRFSRNFGYQNSVFAGLSLATGDAVVELDVDLEDPVEVIPEFVHHWEQGFDVVYGIRKVRHNTRFRGFLFRSFYKIFNFLSDFPIPEEAGDFRLLDRKIVNLLKTLPEKNLYLRGLVPFLGFRQIGIPYNRNARKHGNSKFDVDDYLVLAFDGLTAFSKRPLRFLSMLGFWLFLVSILVSLYYFVCRIIFGTPILGFTTITMLLLILHSITFVFLGVLGEYLSRVFDDAKGRPRVIIAESTHEDDLPRVL